MPGPAEGSRCTVSRYATSISTPLSVDDAFAYMADVTSFKQWDPSIIHSKQVEGAGPGLGAAYDLTIQTTGSVTMRYRTTEFDAPRRMVITAKTALLTSCDEVRVSPAKDGSVVSYDAKLTLNGPLGLFDPLLQLAFNRIGGRAADGLRRVLRGVTLKKGRSP